MPRMLNGLISYCLLGFALSKSLGNYRFFPVLLGLVAYLFFLKAPIKTNEKSPLEKWMIGAIFFSLFRLFAKPGVLYLESSQVEWVLRGLILLAVLGSLFYKRKPGVALAIFSLLSLKILVIHVSPSPGIDVYNTTQLAAAYFWEGKNPYSFVYPDIYAGASGYPAGFLYPPGVLLWVAPFFKFFGDVRYGLLCSEVLIAMGLGFWQRQTQQARLMPLLWLSFPVSLLILEQSWVDTLLIQWILFFYIALENRKFKLAMILMGVLLMTKQYSILVAPFTWIYLKANGLDLKTRIKFGGGVVLTVLLIVLPFLLTDTAGVIHSLVVMPLKQDIRFDSFSLVSLLHHELNWDLNALTILIISLIGLVTTVVVALKKSSFKGTDWTYFNILSFGLIFFVSKQAFCNYFQMLAFFMLLHLAIQLKESRGEVETGV